MRQDLIVKLLVCVQDGGQMTNSLSVRNRVASSEDISHPFWVGWYLCPWFVSVSDAVFHVRMFDCWFMLRTGFVGLF